MKHASIKPAPIRKSIHVAAAPARAFDVFTSGMSRWWLKTHTINRGSPIKEIVMEPKVGGKWFERGEDGSECQWGKVLVWDPPKGVRLSWQITANWSYDPNLVSEVDIRFILDGAGTRVELEHRLDAYGAAAEQVFAIFDSPGGWSGLLDAFGKAAN